MNRQLQYKSYKRDGYHWIERSDGKIIGCYNSLHYAQKILERLEGRVEVKEEPYYRRCAG